MADTFGIKRFKCFLFHFYSFNDFVSFVTEEWTEVFLVHIHEECVRREAFLQRSPKAGSVLVQIHNIIIIMFHIYTVTMETWRR